MYRQRGRTWTFPPESLRGALCCGWHKAAITAGSFDFVENGNPVTAVSLNTAAPTPWPLTEGWTLTQSLDGLTNEKVMYMVGPTRPSSSLTTRQIWKMHARQAVWCFSQIQLEWPGIIFHGWFDSFDGDERGILKTGWALFTPDGSGFNANNYRSSVSTLNLVSGTLMIFRFRGRTP